MTIKKQFITYIDDFLNYLQNIKNYSEQSIITYKEVLFKVINEIELYEDNTEIVFDITKYRILISCNSSKTISKKLSAIKSFIKYLKQLNINVKLIGANSIKVTKTLPKPIKQEDIFNAIKESSNFEKLIIILIYSLGLRISELQNIKLSNIKDQFLIVLGKGNKQRSIPLTDITKNIISKYIQENNLNIYLFEKNGKLLTIRQLQYQVEKAFKKIGIKATPHQLRHSFATDLLNNGARINDISELLGHKSLSATSIYTKLNTKTKYDQYVKAHPLLSTKK
jgi:integrase/recombinase XerC